MLELFSKRLKFIHPIRVYRRLRLRYTNVGSKAVGQITVNNTKKTNENKDIFKDTCDFNNFEFKYRVRLDFKKYRPTKNRL